MSRGWLIFWVIIAQFCMLVSGFSSGYNFGRYKNRKEEVIKVELPDNPYYAIIIESSNEYEIQVFDTKEKWKEEIQRLSGLLFRIKNWQAVKINPAKITSHFTISVDEG